MLRLLLLLVAAWLILSGVRRLLSPPVLPERDQGEGKTQEGIPMSQDPQCGRFVVEQEAVRASLHGQILHFCSPECRDLYTRAHATAQRH